MRALGRRGGGRWTVVRPGDVLARSGERWRNGDPVHKVAAILHLIQSIAEACERKPHRAVRLRERNQGRLQNRKWRAVPDVSVQVVSPKPNIVHATGELQ